jgi:hypothetical protein
MLHYNGDNKGLDQANLEYSNILPLLLLLIIITIIIITIITIDTQR